MNGRVTTLPAMLGAAALAVSTIGAQPATHCIWNVSESVPVGLYLVRPTAGLAVTQLVVVEPPEPLATFLAEGGYLPRGIPMLKRVLALHGQTVCRDQLTITVDKIEVGEARERDSRGRPLPIWQGCRVIADGEIFLMNWQSADSLDGRYFGALPTSAIIGRAEPLWTGTAVARSGGQGRPSSRRASASPLTVASTMAALRSLGTIVCIVAIFASSMLVSSEAHAERASPATHRMSGLSINAFAALVTEASKRFGVPEHWIRAVMHVESGGKQRTRSSKGAIGLMQIMPKTWAELRARHGLGADPYDPRDNILAGAAYIRELSDRYGTPGFLAAYNAGPGRYERHLATGRPLPDETQTYVATLAPMIKSKRVNVQTAAVAKSFAWANSSLFATRKARVGPDARSPADMRQNRSSRARVIVDLSALVPQSGNLFVRRASTGRSQ
jgi:conjugative transfer signal peptidase TraF